MILRAFIAETAETQDLMNAAVAAVETSSKVTDLEAQIEQATASRNEKVEIKAKKMEAKAARSKPGKTTATISNKYAQSIGFCNIC